eukprot:scaffold99593_cov51-Prasinocladus_malaysianus.AAC.4
MCTFDQAHPKPVLSMLPFRLPVACIDQTVAPIESEFLATGLRLSTAQAAVPTTGTAAESVVSDCELEADRCALKLVQHAIKNGLLARALELAGNMHLTPSLEGALRLATHHHQPALAERCDPRTFTALVFGSPAATIGACTAITCFCLRIGQ